MQPARQLAQIREAGGFDKGNGSARPMAASLPLTRPCEAAQACRLCCGLCNAPITGAVICQLIAHLQGRGKQAGQLRTGRSCRQRCVSNGQTEEAGKTQGLHCRAAAFQSTAQSLTAHVDAEDGLHLRRGPPCAGTGGRGQSTSQPALIAGFQGELPGFVDPQAVFGFGQALRRPTPRAFQCCKGALRRGVGLELEQDGAPGQANGQQIAQMRVVLTLLLRLPAEPGAPGSPAVDSQQYRLQIICPHLVRQIQPLQRPLFGGLAGLRQGVQAPAQLRQLHQSADTMVVAQRITPKGV